MKILVPIKRVVDYNVRVTLKRDGSGVELAGVKMSINPFDEIAVEEALRLRERGAGQGTTTEVVVCTLGVTEAQAQLRTALAMGADRAIHVDVAGLDLAGEGLQPLHAARLLRALVEREQPDLVLMGKQAIDDDCNQVGQMLAALWDRPQCTFTSRLTIADGKLEGTRELDAGLETLECDLPAVVTTDLRLNEPRFVKMPDIMKAKSKRLDVVPAVALGVTAPPALTTTAHALPLKRSGGRKVADVAELVSALRDRGAL